MDAKLEDRQIEGFVTRMRVPEKPGPHRLFLLVHGLTGDENVMWIFARRLPEDALLVSLRAPHASDLGGFSWTVEGTEGLQQLDAFRPAVERVVDLLKPENFPQAKLDKVSLVGFSQGAALIYSLGLLHPERVSAMAGLAGYLPSGVDGLVGQRPLDGLPVFHAHGTLDRQVPIDRGRETVRLLEAAGADVTYCEDEVGHKLSLNCFRALEKFFTRM